MSENLLTKGIVKELSKPFDPLKVSLKVQTKPNENGNALIVPYIDARDVIERLNEVAGGDWSDAYQTINGGLECALTVCGVTRRDIGATDNENETEKSAYSDALKRAAVKFGIGLYLYNLPKVWGKVEQHGKMFTPTRESEGEVRRKLFGSVGRNAPPGVPTENDSEPEPPYNKQAREIVLKDLRAKIKAAGGTPAALYPKAIDTPEKLEYEIDVAKQELERIELVAKHQAA